GIPLVRLELVFFPTDIAHRTGPPAFCPMSQVGNSVLGSASKTFWLLHHFGILHFGFRHWATPLTKIQTLIVASADMSQTAAIVDRTRPGYWSAIREAVRGSQQDFTEGSLRRAIILLAIPMVLEMVMESLFAIVDVFWVAHLGANAIATVGL